MSHLHQSQVSLFRTAFLGTMFYGESTKNVLSEGPKYIDSRPSLNQSKNVHLNNNSYRKALKNINESDCGLRANRSQVDITNLRDCFSVLIFSQTMIRNQQVVSKNIYTQNKYFMQIAEHLLLHPATDDTLVLFQMENCIYDVLFLFLCSRHKEAMAGKIRHFCQKVLFIHFLSSWPVLGQAV